MSLSDVGALRVGINLANPLLVSGRAGDGDPFGVAPSLGAALAARHRVSHRFVTYAGAGSLAAATDWDVAFLADDPARSATISFSPPYAEIEVRYLAHSSSGPADAGEVDRPGASVIAEAGSAYELWLSANLRSADLIRADGRDDAWRLFSASDGSVLAGLAPALRLLAEDGSGRRLLPGRVTSVRQAIGVPADRPTAAAEAGAFVRDAIASGLVEDLVVRYGVADALVIPQ